MYTASHESRGEKAVAMKEAGRPSAIAPATSNERTSFAWKTEIYQTAHRSARQSGARDACSLPALPAIKRRRKEIVVYLDRLRHECERTIRKASGLHEFFKSDLEAIKARPLREVRRALADVFDLDTDPYGPHQDYISLVSSTIAEMVGIARSPRDGETLLQWRNRVMSVIFDWDDDPPRSRPGDLTTQKAQPAKARPASKGVTPAPSADMALTEALRIAREAQDASVEIDWTDNPASDREAELRLAIIRRIESEQTAFWGQPSYYGLLSLQDLAPNAEATGQDLYDAIKRWRVRCHEYRVEHNAKERRRLLDAARKGIDEASSGR